MTTTTRPDLLAPTELLDHDSPEVRAFVARVIPDPAAMTPTEKAVALYYAVRDKVFYEVYGQDLSRQGLRASSIATRGQGFCLHKSILYAAAVRSVGIPSRVLCGEVRNHLASGRLKQVVGGEVFLHWLDAIELDGRWLRVTPVFNKMLCKLYGMKPLEFDGTADSLYHPFDDDGRERMEFVGPKTEFDDVDYDDVLRRMREKHPAMVGDDGRVAAQGSLAAEAPQVIGGSCAPGAMQCS